MSLVAEFSLRSPNLPLMAALDGARDVTVELEQQFGTDAAAPTLVVWAFGDDFEGFAAGLDDDPTVDDHAVVDDCGSRRLYRIRLVPEEIPALYPIYHRIGASPMAATGSATGWQRRVRFPDRDAVVEMRRSCADRDVRFRLHRLYAPGASDLEDEFGLSAEQRQALVTAERVGYFEVPRDVSLSELGDELDVSGQSVSERLRRGMSRLVSNTLLSDF